MYSAARLRCLLVVGAEAPRAVVGEVLAVDVVMVLDVETELPVLEQVLLPWLWLVDVEKPVRPLRAAAEEDVLPARRGHRRRSIR